MKTLKTHSKKDIEDRLHGKSGDLREYIGEFVYGGIDGSVTTFAVVMKEELEMQQETRSPLNTALVTFGSFVLVGFIPLIAYVVTYLFPLKLSNLFLLSCIMTSVAFMIIGWMKSFVTHTGRIRGILETILLGGLAAGVAYFVGHVLKQLLGG